MSRYDGRFRAIERKLPREYKGNCNVEIGNEDGTITTEDGRRLEAHEYKREMEARGEEVILIGYDMTEEEKREDEERTERWHKWNTDHGYSPDGRTKLDSLPAGVNGQSNIERRAPYDIRRTPD